MPQIHYVIVHRPGPAWQAGVDFQEQVGVQDHVNYFAGLLADGRLFGGGPFVDSSGGMMILSAVVSADDAARVAENDPAVKTGLLVADVRPWLRAFEGGN